MSEVVGIPPEPLVIAFDLGNKTGWATPAASGMTVVDARDGKKGRAGKPAKLSPKGLLLRPASPPIPAIPPEPDYYRCGHLRSLIDEVCLPWLAPTWLLGTPLARRGPLYMVVESALVRHASQRAALVAHELHGVLKSWCCEHRVRLFEVKPSDLKRHATGKSDADKLLEMLPAARSKLGYQGESLDEMDALWLRDWGLQHIPALLTGSEAVS